DDLRPLYKRISASERYAEQVRSKFYTVKRGDTLSGIALRFGTSVRTLKRLNTSGRR
ncbi:MAG: LysM peptidoglycan-binding domain-containing protein, partial [Nitrospinaceae bacterium]|nr:LysM peptidoglycan-binding domain-containing protein [Nitrospinaceae bacterium]NIR57715.1 LysM peptidoglycan-binding domain-containing protein [Nitrospinaceae bacterium]NIS87942.1 LysM peptidoglycan-binding domain-containing protein [Nitrospinaceae bacterium]NIT85057.1 LysM peptidoglycan-binding domain-containing protein [Nitrospinaceae bacterium]NIU46986.1 LysM peptidoglycan-binding domain-containing protein [Nitrospinaceae bacterium]